MGSLAVVVIDVLLKNQLQVALAKDEHPVQSFVAQCLDHSLAVGVRSRAPVGREGHFGCGVQISRRHHPRRRRVVGYHPGRPWSLPASTAAFASSSVCSCSGLTVIATAMLNCLSFATN